ncbi:MAG TPA: hydrogenase maturation nickel metallochaperone HypA [Candidatus Methylacidiphilales bacterium]|nr:hydrogenase maturation nickel metallochaperone HypA [Candidatus Methylacidiphilales bacterium]
MHEYSIVESIVNSMLEGIKKQKATKVTSVRFKRGSAFSEEAFRQAYQSLTIGTVLEGAPLQIETVNLDFNCNCGHHQVITSDDLVGHMFICPGCGATKEIDEAHDLELVELLAQTND